MSETDANIFCVRYAGARICVSRSAMRDLMKHGCDLYDTLKVLEEGKDSPRKRKRGVIEKWLARGKKTYEAIIASGYDEITKEKVWKLIHFGRFAKK